MTILQFEKQLNRSILHRRIHRTASIFDAQNSALTYRI